MDEDAPSDPAPSTTCGDSLLELSLEGSIDALFEAAERARADPTFPNATDACLASRIAWGVFFSEWQAAGGCARELTERLRAGLSSCKEAVQLAAREGSVTDDERELIDKFAHSTEFRGRMLDLLVAEGPAAVVAAVDEENERRMKQSELKEPSARR